MTHPTGYTALDLVGFTDKGTYASNVAYVKNDIVHYTGSLWRCKIDDTTNVTPGENANWTAFIGEPQSLVERIIAPLEDNPATVAYLTGRQIIYDDWLWEVIADIAVGDALIDYDVDPTNANIKKAVPVETQLLAIKAKEGNLTNLNTTAKNDLVSAVNEVNDKTKYKILQRDTAYSVDDFVLCKSASNSLIFVCTTGGTTAVSEPTGYTTITDGNTITDGTAVFKAVNVSGAINSVSGKADQTLLAPVETNLSSASQAYAIGDQFIYNGLLYKATAAITQGGTIVIGSSGNAVLADCVTKQMNDLFLIENKTVIISSIPSNDSASGNVDASKSGYKILGVVGYAQSYASGLIISYAQIVNNNVYANAYNASSINYTNVPITVAVLYAKL